MSRDLALEKGLPAAVEFEALVLGALLAGVAEYQLVAGVLASDAFFLEKHRRVFDSMSEAYTAGAPISIVSIAEVLRRRNQLDSCDGISGLATLASDVPDRLVNLEHYCTAIKDKSILRKLIFKSRKLIDECVLGQDTAAAILSRAGDLFRGLEGETAPQA